jgi:hypothetical protein
MSNTLIKRKSQTTPERLWCFIKCNPGLTVVELEQKGPTKTPTNHLANMRRQGVVYIKKEINKNNNAIHRYYPVGNHYIDHGPSKLLGEQSAEVFVNRLTVTQARELYTQLHKTFGVINPDWLAS